MWSRRTHYLITSLKNMLMIGITDKWVKSRGSGMYRTLSLTPEVVIERNRPGEEGKEDEGRGMGREADSFSVGKQQEFMCEGEIPRTHAVLLW